jgi:hypothetical protein
MKISFDFDDTLTEKHMQQLAVSLCGSGADVYIITTRLAGFGQEVYQLASQLGIAQDKIYFTHRASKASLVDQLEIDIHFDDDPAEVESIGQKGRMAVLVKLDNVVLQRFLQNRGY